MTFSDFIFLIALVPGFIMFLDFADEILAGALNHYHGSICRMISDHALFNIKVCFYLLISLAGAIKLCGLMV